MKKRYNELRRVARIAKFLSRLLLVYALLVTFTQVEMYIRYNGQYFDALAMLTRFLDVYALPVIFWVASLLLSGQADIIAATYPRTESRSQSRRDNSPNNADPPPLMPRRPAHTDIEPVQPPPPDLVEPIRPRVYGYTKLVPRLQKRKIAVNLDDE